MVAINIVKCCKSLKRSSDINIKCLLVRPKIEVLDYAWSKRIIQLVSQRQELENAMSWLSTLGGAFSALGDNFESCAKVAAKISIQQFKIAFQLGEPLLLARCRLYMALSLIQLGKLSSAKKVIQNQYLLSKSFNDIRLEKMCKGIWTKLQYVYKQKYNRLKQYHNNKLQII
ncbi:hypothetical protein RUM44_013910 [Polyplax serrata]|uniref:Uncharacterized protein n=1 Tax=Polyplax serrata TaxID=468196 RepID=A0ABR1BFS0_POLSC